MTIRVLLVDDVEALRALYRLALEGADAEIDVVGEAQDGVEAVQLAESLRPDVILLDLAMPNMDGLAAIPRIKAAAPSSRILVLSGFTSAALAREALARCAYDYLEKGMSVDRIVSRIQKVHTAPPKLCGAA